MNRIITSLCVFFIALLTINAGCGGDPNVEGAKLALTLDDVDYDEYLGKLDESIATNPDNAEAYEVKGKLLQKKMGPVNDPAERADLIGMMVESFHKALEIQPEYPAVVQQLQQSYVTEFQKGIQAFNRAKEDQTAYNDAAAYFGNTSMIMPDSAGPYVNQAYALINAGRESEAMTPFEMALDKGDVEPETYLLLANLYQSNERVGDAVALLEKSRDMFPERDDLQTQLLNAYIASGQMDRAKEVYAEAVEREPDNKLFHYNYGTLLLEAEDYDGAIKHFQAAVDLDPEYSVAFYNLGATFVNKAVTINDQIQVLDDELRSERDNMSDSDVEAKESELNTMVESRTEQFQMAIDPLEKARALQQAAGEDAAVTCSALFTAYVQVGEDTKAEEAASCAGIDLN